MPDTVSLVESRAPATHACGAERGSRARALGELLLLTTALEWVLWTESKHVMPQPYRSMGAAVLVGVVLALLVGQRPSRRELGLAPDSWTAGLGRLLLFSSLATGLLAALGWCLGTLGRVDRFWYWVLRIWHLQAGQQVLLQILLVPRLVTVLRTEGPRVSVIAAIAFGLLHAPNGPLMLLSLPAAVAWCEWFRRYRNFPAVWASHLLLAGAALYSLNPVLGKLRVGVGYLFLP